MNNTFKAIQTVAIGIPIILYSETKAEAKSFPDSEQNTQKLVELQSKTAKYLTYGHAPDRSSVIKPKDHSQSLISQSLTQPQVNLNSNLDNLNPNANPLQLPTKAPQVQIEIDRPISLKQAIKLAVRNNQNLQEARLNLERSQQELREARAALFPTLDTQLDISEVESAESEISLELSRQQGVNDLDEDTSSSSFNGSINLTYDLYTGGGRGADIERAKKQVRFNELDLERITFQTRFETARDYYSLQNADSQVEIEQAAVEDANQTLQDAQLLQQSGLGTNFDVLRAEVELANAQQRLTTAQAEQSTAKRQLATTLGVGQQVELKTKGEIQTAGDWKLSLEETIVLAYKNRAELQQLLVSREINAKQRQIALSTIRPQISFLASYNVLEVSDDGVDLTDGYTIGGRLEWNLFDGGGARARAKQSETDIRIDETQFANQRNQIRFEVEQGYFAFTASRDNITTSEKAVELAEESLALARLRFQSGVGTQTDVIQAQSELTTARANFSQAIIDYNQSLNQIERAVTNLPNEMLSDATF